MSKFTKKSLEISSLIAKEILEKLNEFGDNENLKIGYLSSQLLNFKRNFKNKKEENSNLGQ